jgi:hypothetical protein
MLLQSTELSPSAWSVADGATSRDPEPRSSISVRFVEDDRPFISVMEVVVPGKWDVIADVYRTLYNLRAQVIHAVIRYMDDGSWLRYRLYVVEFDGAMLDERRHRELVETVESRLRALAPELQVPESRVGREEAPLQSGVRRAVVRAMPRAGIEPASQVAEGR